jgi:N-methylhydantoinase A/oxoprolinase/acetone carboxylase beta subunit
MSSGRLKLTQVKFSTRVVTLSVQQLFGAVASPTHTYVGAVEAVLAWSRRLLTLSPLGSLLSVAVSSLFSILMSGVVASVVAVTALAAVCTAAVPAGSSEVARL